MGKKTVKPVAEVAPAPEEHVEDLTGSANIQIDVAKPEPPTTLYIGHLPHGFYERELKKYFSQFGDVVNVRVSRNKKTGNSKGYAFVQFASTDVATKAAGVMDKYLVMGKMLDVHLVSKLHPDIWKGANKKFVLAPKRESARLVHNKVRTADEQATANKRKTKRRQSAKAAADEYLSIVKK